MDIPIKYLQKTSLVNYPSKICSVLFIGGCNFLCHYCYNPSLVLTFPCIPTIPIQKVLSELEARKKYVDGICITGGEPTIYDELPLLIKEIKKLGYSVKLDTNGTNPSMLKELIYNKIVDYIAMDIKATENNYYKIVGRKVDINSINESIKILLNSDIDYEFRTTLIKGELTEEDIITIGRWLRGAKRYCLQQFRNTTELIDNSFKNKSCYSKSEMEVLKNKVEQYFNEVILRCN